MDIMTMAMCKPKVIDLDSYISAGATLSDALVLLFSRGGGELECASDGGLFNDLKTKRPIKVQFTFGAAVVSTTNVTALVIDGDLRQIFFEATTYYEGEMLHVTVSLTPLDSGKLSISLKFAPV